MKTTLNKICSCNPCECGLKKLIKYLGKSNPDDEPLEVKTILESNGIKDAIWSLRAVDGYDREIRLFACWCACQSLDIFESQYFNDIRPRKAIETAACFSEELCYIDELAAARAAAWDAARAVAGAAAWDAAWFAAVATARAVAWDAAWDAAWFAAVATARAVAWDTAWDAAVAAAWDAQKEQLLILCNLKHDYMLCE